MTSKVVETKLGAMPLVSILMNCFNGEKYLREAIDSVMAQTYTNWEIIFWDNQSTDSTASIVKSYSDPRIRYYYAPTHTLLYEARNYAFVKATGELIAFLDVDDSWAPEKLQGQVPLFLDPKVGFACSNYWIADQLKDKRWLACKKLMQSGKVLNTLLRYYYVGLLTLIVRRSALSPQYPPFNPRFHIIGDFDLVIRLAAVWDLAYTHEPLAVYRIHGDNESIKRQELLILEWEYWVNEKSKDGLIANACSHGSLGVYLNYSKARQAMLCSNRAEAFSYIQRMPWCYLKGKVLFGLMLPTKLVQKIF